jgi:DNA-binding response OmpR family regulator
VTGKLIYLLEDDPDILQVIQLLLSRHGFRVAVFNTAVDFKKQIHVALPDLCIMDVSLPDGNGLDISLELSSAPFTSRIPILIISANLFQQDKYKHAGARGFINKPFDIGHFMDIVRNLTG